MLNKNISKYLLFLLIGLIIFIVGAVLTKFTKYLPETMQTLPFILIGIGAGVFGQNLGNLINLYLMKKNPQLAQVQKIEAQDERNITITNKAKAKAYDLMVIAFGILLLMLSLMNIDLTTILALVITYLLVVFSNIYFINKYSKEI